MSTHVESLGHMGSGWREGGLSWLRQVPKDALEMPDRSVDPVCAESPL
jgi:hypothetical protein